MLEVELLIQFAAATAAVPDRGSTITQRTDPLVRIAARARRFPADAAQITAAAPEQDRGRGQRGRFQRGRRPNQGRLKRGQPARAEAADIVA